MTALHAPVSRLGVIALLCLLSSVASGESIASTYHLDLVARQGQVVDGQELDLFRGVALNHLGQVAYTAVAVDDQTAALSGVALLVDGRRVVATGDPIANGDLGFLGEPDLTDDGTVAYSADVFPNGSPLASTGAVVGSLSDPLSHQLVIGGGSSIGGTVLNGAINPSLSESGSFAYTAIYFDTTLDLSASAVLHDGTVVAATGDLVGNRIVNTVDRPSLNNRSGLAFEASLIDLTTTESLGAIFLNSQLVAASGDVVDGIELMEVFSPSVNDHGDLAYVARYLDIDLNLDNMAVVLNGEAVIESGDLSTEGLILDQILDIAINNAGQIALLATFIDPADGTFFEEGIFVSRVVPEPATGLGATLAVILTAAIRSRLTKAGWPRPSRHGLPKWPFVVMSFCRRRCGGRFWSPL